MKRILILFISITLILILFISIFTLNPTFVQTAKIDIWSQKGYVLYLQGNYTEAAKWLRKAA